MRQFSRFSHDFANHHIALQHGCKTSPRNLLPSLPSRQRRRPTPPPNTLHPSPSSWPQDLAVSIMQQQRQQQLLLPSTLHPSPAVSLSLTQPLTPPPHLQTSNHHGSSVLRATAAGAMSSAARLTSCQRLLQRTPPSSHLLKPLPHYRWLQTPPRLPNPRSGAALCSISVQLSPSF